MVNILDSKKLYISFVITCIAFIFYGLISQILFGEKIFNLIISTWQSLILSILIISFSYFVRFLRWRYLILSFGNNVDVKSDFVNWLSSFAFAATPGKIGDLVRINFYNNDFGISKSKIFTILALEKITDLISIILICILSFNFVYGFKNSILISSFLFLFLFFLIYLNRKFIERRLIKFFQFKRKYKMLFNKINSLKKVFNLRVLIISLFVGSIGWLIESLSIYKLLISFKGLDFSLFQTAFAHTFSTLVGLISFIPAGIAATEFTSSKIFFNFGLEMDDAIIYSFLIRLVSIWFATVLGFFIFFIRLIKKRI